MNSDEIEKRKYITAPRDGCKCDGCNKPVKGRDRLLRFAQKDKAGSIEFKFYGNCCAWQY